MFRLNEITLLSTSQRGYKYDYINMFRNFPSYNYIYLISAARALTHKEHKQLANASIGTAAKLDTLGKMLLTVKRHLYAQIVSCETFCQKTAQISP